jgi:rod shape-determining protein MreB
VPKEITINQANIAEALAEPIGQIIEGVRIALENTRPSWPPTSSTRASC